MAKAANSASLFSPPQQGTAVLGQSLPQQGCALALLSTQAGLSTLGLQFCWVNNGRVMNTPSAAPRNAWNRLPAGAELGTTPGPGGPTHVYNLPVHSHCQAEHLGVMTGKCCQSWAMSPLVIALVKANLENSREKGNTALGGPAGRTQEAGPLGGRPLIRQVGGAARR